MKTFIFDRYLWNYALHLPQTYWLLCGLISGNISSLVFVGNRSIVIATGVLISGSIIILWLAKLYRILLKMSLLEKIAFEMRLSASDRSIFVKSQVRWKRVCQWSKATHEFAIQIARKEPTLIPDLLEVLHTVLALAEGVADLLKAQKQVQSSTYCGATERQLKAKCDRLKDTCDRLQELQDMLLLSQSNNNHISDLPLRLQIAIEANKIIL